MAVKIPGSGHLRGRFTRRMFMVGLGQTALMGVLGARLYQLQVSEASRYRRLAEKNRIGIQMFAPTRGRILDRNGVALAANREIRRLVIIPDLAGNLDEMLDLLSRIVSISPERLDAVLRLAKSQNNRIPIHVKSGLSWEEMARINVMMPQLSGVETQYGFTRLYPHGADFGHLTGYVGAVERFEIDGDPVLHLPGMLVGKAGVERGFEKRLRGRGGNVKVEIDSKGHILRTIDKTEQIAGSDIALSIDSRLQRRAMHRLKREKRASVVAMDVKSGQILVMASNPSFDPQRIASGISLADWNQLLTEPGNPLTNRAIRGQYPPGSTFKMVTALAALEAGVIDEKKKSYCGGSYRFADHTYRCWKSSGHRDVDLHKALRESCDVFFYDAARKTGITALSAMARRLGFGQTFDCGLPDQKPGLIPDQDWKIARFNRGWLDGETVLAGIGQGYVLTTPLQLAVMTARIATGRKIVPMMVKADYTAERDLSEPLGLNENHLRLVRNGMFASVNEAGGTGSNAQLAFSDIMIAGKTGTSQVARSASNGHDRRLKWEERNHALFVSYFPHDAPRYAVAVIVDHGGSGGRSAAPLARDVMTDLVQLDPLKTPSNGPGNLTGDQLGEGEPA